ncbi:MAG: MerR family transcriptional regulator [Paludibacter sp.]|nr:MerR family transcriptional regulator [Paludibacter sp.]
MRTVKEVSEITGISIRALRYYDEIGLLKPTALTEASYRLYDDEALERLQQILFFRELEIPLEDIKAIMENPNYDKEQALLTQKSLLEHKRNRLNGIIELITDVIKGINTMNFEAFTNEDVKKILDHSLDLLDEQTLEILITKYGDIETFRASVSDELKKNSTHYIKMFGSKDKAVAASLQNPLGQDTIAELNKENDDIYWQFAKAKETDDIRLATNTVERLADNSKRMFRLDNARYLMLQMAEHYLHPQDYPYPEVIEAISKKYGIGITEYIGHAIQQYYGM